MSSVMRFIILGESNTGKTRFFNKLQNMHKKEPIPATGTKEYTGPHDIDVLTYSCDTNTKIIIWDTTGEKLFRTIITSYMRNNCGYFLFFDLSDPSSIETSEEWIKMIMFFNTCYHDHPIMLVGIKNNQNCIDHDNLAKLVLRYKLIYMSVPGDLSDPNVIMDTMITEVQIRLVNNGVCCNGIKTPNNRTIHLTPKPYTDTDTDTDTHQNKCY
uniref:GTP-binding protein n=1 Tax=viral metagenome TaxID=1070528 RepID=A0A6C0LWE1_9ZZZZ